MADEQKTVFITNRRKTHERGMAIRRRWNE